MQAEDPTFFASMAGSQVRRRRSVWGSVTFLLGLAAFLFGAVMAQALPGVGVGVSVAGFLAIFARVTDTSLTEGNRNWRDRTTRRVRSESRTATPRAETNTCHRPENRASPTTFNSVAGIVRNSISTNRNYPGVARGS